MEVGAPPLASRLPSVGWPTRLVRPRVLVRACSEEMPRSEKSLTAATRPASVRARARTSSPEKSCRSTPSTGSPTWRTLAPGEVPTTMSLPMVRTLRMSFSSLSMRTLVSLPFMSRERSSPLGPVPMSRRFWWGTMAQICSTLSSAKGVTLPAASMRWMTPPGRVAASRSPFGSWARAETTAPLSSASFSTVGAGRAPGLGLGSSLPGLAPLPSMRTRWTVAASAVPM